MSLIKAGRPVTCTSLLDELVFYELGQQSPRKCARSMSTVCLKSDTRAPMTKQEPLLWGFRAICCSRSIAIIDGAMGTTIRTLRDDGSGHARGRGLRKPPKDLLNNGDLFSLTQPAMIEDIHRRFLEAGADIIETNTFGATSHYAVASFLWMIRVRRGGRKDPEFYQRVIVEDTSSWSGFG